MSHARLFTQALIDCREKAMVGGKAANLGRLVRAGFAVPGGFVVTTDAYRFAQRPGSNGNGNGRRDPGSLALPKKSPGKFVRLIAPWETARSRFDLPQPPRTWGPRRWRGSTKRFSTSLARRLCSMPSIAAGPVSIRRGFALIFNEHGIDPARVAMAVVVQQLVPAAVAGVLFTANPHNGSSREMLVEASWGLGESVVSGRVQPDVLRLEHETGKVLAATIADKRVHLAPGAHEEQQVDDARRKLPCLRTGATCIVSGK